MKKTMFITSVIMVIVMAIALTTSSLAWFSASGADTVTTSSLKLTATGAASTGIAISHDGNQWASNIILTSNGTGANAGIQVNMNPLVPYTKTTAYTPGELTGTDLTNEQNRVLAAFIASLVGGTENAYNSENAETYNFYGTTAANTSYSAYMIGAKIDSNKKFVDGAANVMRGGYYADTLYLKNLATGAEAKNIQFKVDIGFGFDDSGTYKSYTTGNRGAAKYQEDAVLCVAVLARTNEFDTDANLDVANYAAASGTFDDPAAYLDPTKWELVAYADSKNGSNVNLGLTYAQFLAGQNSVSSYKATPIADVMGLAKDATAVDPWTSYKSDGETTITVSSDTYKKVSTEELRPERAGPTTGDTLAATSKTIKVIAWYDGSTLNNNNSTKMDLEFSLRFSKVVVNN